MKSSANRLFLIAVLLAATTLAAHAKIDRTIEKTFTVQPGGTLHVETSGGEIRLAPSTDSTINVTAHEHIRANSEAEADDILKKLELSIEQNGTDVLAKAKYDRETFTGFHWGSWPPVSVDFVISAPASFCSELHTSGGSITVGDMAAKVFARTSGGAIHLGKIGAEVDAHTSGGSVSLDEAAASVKLGTSGGGITVGKVTGEAELSTSGGSIKIDSVQGAVHASTSGGSVRATLVGPVKDNCVLSTSGGSVKLTVDKSAAFHLDAATSGGEVDANGLTLTLEHTNRSHSHLSGTVNGGSANVRLHSSGGDIVIRAI